jgi:hypothetical protein
MLLSGQQFRTWAELDRTIPKTKTWKVSYSVLGNELFRHKIFMQTPKSLYAYRLNSKTAIEIARISSKFVDPNRPNRNKIQTIKGRIRTFHRHQYHHFQSSRSGVSQPRSTRTRLAFRCFPPQPPWRQIPLLPSPPPRAAACPLRDPGMDTVEKIVEDFASDIAMSPFSSGTRLR